MTNHPAAWAELTAELDLWAAENRQAHFWWRDDDATKPNSALDRLLELQTITGAPLALAVIPAQAEAGLTERLVGLSGVAALQHGYIHHNHASAGEKKSEFPASRPLRARLTDIRQGQEILAAKFAAPARQPVFVPPWNRMAPDMLPGLAELGFQAVSAFKPRQTYWAAPGLAWLNTQLDPIDWHGNDNPAATAACLQAATGLLRAMRGGIVLLQPVGFLTHHLRHDTVLWSFVAEFIAAIAAHPAGRWLDTTAALAIGRPAEIPPAVTRTS
ncbi:MAG: polysaccharide deacetylase family protein [Ferrovibrio sp.]|uniref:polysaccharide deacetylase family protein n=1 Tax=Ferrovibrio sp. TaxID=1917215 RepID=UPI00391AF3DF